ncbi:5486_t:CDS:2 [Racocetra fulgida]|uniref:5486_t:CDS:1 n=1 Tax=Racocetra fulgida TaxID=60492 RepID=A0A9N8ZYN1_9GLOM|nr:5486_t:CDS:2 [Racocetra fulgida]
MAIAVVYMTKEFNFTSTIQGVILSSFFLGYLSTQVLGGALADKYGFVWSILWQIYGKSNPNEYPGISQEELDWISKNKKKNKPSQKLNYHRIESSEIAIESTTSENDNAISDVPLANFIVEEDNNFEAEADVLLPENLIMSNPKEVPWKFLLSRRELK